LGLSVLAPTSFSLVGDLFGSQERGRVVGVMRAFGTIGTIVTFGILPVIARRDPEGWRIGFVTFGLASLITGALMMLIKEPPRGASEPELKDVITDKAAGRYTFKWADLRALAKIRSWWLFALKDVLGTMGIGVFFGWGFTWLAGLGLGELGSIVILVILVGAVVGYIISGWLGDRLERRFPEQGRNVLILAGLVLMLPVIIALLTTTGRDLTRLLATGLLFSLTLGMSSESVSWPVAQSVLPPELRGSGRAAISMVSGLASALILSLSSLVVAKVGIASMQLLIVPIPLFLSIVAWLPMFRTYPRDRAALHEALTRRRAELLDEQKK
jgi:MFS family permease